MKDWRIWAAIIVLFFLIRMCGGCGSSSDVDKAELESAIHCLYDARIYDVEVSSVKKVKNSPPTYKVKYSYYYLGRCVDGKEAFCTLKEDGKIDVIWDENKTRDHRYSAW